MGYYTIYYNQSGEPYIIEKNFGHKPEKNNGSSHWTWHINERGVRHLSRDFFGRPQKMPKFINEEQLADLKTYNMLQRSNGSSLNSGGIYPTRIEKTPKRQSVSNPAVKSARKKPARTKTPVKASPRPVARATFTPPAKTAAPATIAATPQPRIEAKPVAQEKPVVQENAPRKVAEKPQKGLWGRIKSLFGKS